MPSGAFIGCIIEIVYKVFYKSAPPGLFGQLPPKKTPEVPAGQTAVLPANLDPSQNNEVPVSEVSPTIWIQSQKQKQQQQQFMHLSADSL